MRAERELHVADSTPAPSATATDICLLWARFFKERGTCHAHGPQSDLCVSRSAGSNITIVINEM